MTQSMRATWVCCWELDDVIDFRWSKCLPSGFFNTAETSALARLGDNQAAVSAIKDKIFARYASHSDAETIRSNLQNTQFDIKAGPSSYFA